MIATLPISMNKSSVPTFGYLQTHMNLIMCFLFNGFLGFAETSMAPLFYRIAGGGWVACRLIDGPEIRMYFMTNLVLDIDHWVVNAAAQNWSACESVYSVEFFSPTIYKIYFSGRIRLISTQTWAESLCSSGAEEFCRVGVVLLPRKHKLLQIPEPLKIGGLYTIYGFL